MNPRVAFKIDPRKDMRSLEAFAAQAPFDNGRSLRWAVLKKHPSLKRAFKNGAIVDRTHIERYIADAYRKDRVSAKRNMARYARDWRKKEKVFFAMTDALFGDFPWPKGAYAAYATIWGMFPRFLDDKTFQVPMKYRAARAIPVIVAHEMLHFRFYAYIEARSPRYRDPERNLLLWHISEIFNIIVINSPEWQKVFSSRNLPYPEHRAIIAALRKRYPHATSFDLDRLIRDIHPLAKKLMARPA